MSRSRTKRVARMSDTPRMKTNSSTRRGKSHNQDSRGGTPAYARKPATTTRWTRNVIAAVSTAEVGITILGKVSFLSSDSLETSEIMLSVVASAKKKKHTIPIRSDCG